MIVLVREGKRVAVYLDGSMTPEIAGETAATPAREAAVEIWIGARGDGLASFEGKIDEASTTIIALPASLARLRRRFRRGRRESAGRSSPWAPWASAALLLSRFRRTWRMR
jgi:hypothetical protein